MCGTPIESMSTSVSALSGVKTMESVTLPGAILLALAALAAIQLALTW